MNVIVYSTDACPFCVMVKQYLKQKGIDFQEFNVGENQEKAREMIEKSGQQGVPVLDINGKIIIGFDKPKIDEALGLN
jgi:glutaredoxin 3